MKIYPTTAETKLGFDALRERLEGYTLSRLGQGRVENMRPAGSLAWAREELQRVSELQQAFRFDDPVPLTHVLDIREVVRRAAPEGSFVATEDLHATRLVLQTLRQVRSYFDHRKEKYPALSATTARIIPLSDVENRIAAVVDDEGRLRDDASPALRQIRRTLVNKQVQLRETLQAELRRAIGSGFATEDQPTIRNGRMVIPVRAEARRKIAGFVQDVSATGQTVYVEPASCLDLNNEVRELESEERREIERILRDTTDLLRVHLEALKENLRALAGLDVLQAKARLANELDAVVPQLNDRGRIHIRKGRNPVLQLRFARMKEHGEIREVVPLDLSLGIDFNTLIITGPNAGGKTVAMKTVGLFAMMLGYGLPIPADPLSEFAIFDELIVDLGDEQSIEEDLSTFSSHVSNLKYMLGRAGQGTLILIDEAGTGTDPAEGGALAQAVLEQLSSAGARTIATTHHGTLKVFAHETPGIENGSMQFDQATLSPTYRFQSRIPGSSYAFEIAQRIGLHRPVLARARELVGGQKTSLEDLIATFERRNQELTAKLKEAETNAKRAAEERARYEERAEALRANQEEIRRKALEEAERIVEEANRQVERTIREIKEAQAEREATRAARESLDKLRESITERRRKAEANRAQARQRQQVAKPAAKPRPAPAPAPSDTRITVGDQVVLDGGSTVAEVIEIEGNEALITFDAMRIRARLNRLQKVSGPRKQSVTVRQVSRPSEPIAALSARTSVDVRGYRVDEALTEVDVLVDRAMAAGLERVEILHGKGTGALRTAIQDHLARHPDVAGYEEAPWEQGGPGVTYVHLK